MMADTHLGTIILLNGTASSGKTSLAKAIQHSFDVPYLLVGIDLFWERMFPWAWAGATSAAWQHRPVSGTFPPKTAIVMTPFAHFVHSGLHHTVAALARIGHNVVVDHVLYAVPDLHECLSLWQAFSVWLVGVQCPLEVVRQRAAVRTDRSGWKEYRDVVTWQFDEVHKHTRGLYDIEVDTSRLTPTECAFQIKQILDERSSPSAFKQLAALIPGTSH
jgi:chloramphenicol 3-O phosphotransferase